MVYKLNVSFTLVTETYPCARMTEKEMLTKLKKSRE